MLREQDIEAVRVLLRFRVLVRLHGVKIASMITDVGTKRDQKGGPSLGH